MKKLNLIIAIIGLIGIYLGFFSFLYSETNEQIIFSIVLFLLFSIMVILAVVLNDVDIKRL